MLPCITRSRAVWVSGDSKSRKGLDDTVYSAIGNTKVDGLPKDISKIVVDYLESDYCFGENEWTALFGRVDPAPPLPPDFSKIWYGQCPIYPDKKVSETHMLVYIPATVDGKRLTLKKLGEIAKRFFPKNDKGYRYILPSMEDKSIDKSRWVLMTKDVLPESRNKSYPEQEKIVASLNKKCFGYKIPDAIEAAACILAQYFYSKTRLFNHTPCTYTLCTDQVEGYYATVGGFSHEGLVVLHDLYRGEGLGVAALRKF